MVAKHAVDANALVANTHYRIIALFLADRINEAFKALQERKTKPAIA